MQNFPSCILLSSQRNFGFFPSLNIRCFSRKSRFSSEPSIRADSQAPSAILAKVDGALLLLNRTVNYLVELPFSNLTNSKLKAVTGSWYFSFSLLMLMCFLTSKKYDEKLRFNSGFTKLLLLFCLFRLYRNNGS